MLEGNLLVFETFKRNVSDRMCETEGRLSERCPQARSESGMRGLYHAGEKVF